jgi:hypothetical protein
VVKPSFLVENQNVLLAFLVILAGETPFADKITNGNKKNHWPKKNNLEKKNTLNTHIGKTNILLVSRVKFPYGYV